MTTCAIPVSCWASVSAAWVSRNGCHGVFLATWPIVCDRMNVQKFTNGIFVSFLNWKCYFLQCSCHKLKVDKYTLVVPKCCSWENSPSQYFAGSVALNRYLLWIISSCQVHIALAIPGWHMQWVMSLFCHIYFVRLLATVAQWHIQQLSMTSQVWYWPQWPHFSGGETQKTLVYWDFSMLKTLVVEIDPELCSVPCLIALNIASTLH